MACMRGERVVLESLLRVLAAHTHALLVHHAEEEVGISVTLAGGLGREVWGEVWNYDPGWQPGRWEVWGGGVCGGTMTLAGSLAGVVRKGGGKEGGGGVRCDPGQQPGRGM